MEAIASGSWCAALDDARLTPLHWRIWFLSAMGIFLDGFDLFILAVALPALRADFRPGTLMFALIPASAVFGAVVGAVVVGRLTDHFGRKRVFSIDLIGFVVFSLLSALSWNPISLIVFRFLLGVAVGADYPISATYIAEVMPSRRRGRMLAAAFSCQAFGMLAAAAVGVIVLVLYPHSGAWRWMLVAGAVPAAITTLLRTSLPESPRWCAGHGHTDKAVEIIEALTEQKLSAQARQQIADSAAPELTGRERTLPFSALFSPRYLRLTILAAVPWFLMDIATYGIGLFTPTILAAIAFSRDGSFIAKDIASAKGAAALDVFLVVGFALNILLVERAGRIRLQLIGFAGMAAGLLLVGAAAGSVQLEGDKLPLIFAGFILFNLLMNMGPNATTYLLPSELFPSSIRASGSGLAASAGKLGAVVGIFMLPLARHAWGIGPTLAVVAIVSLLGLTVTYAFRVETSGRSLEAAETDPRPALADGLEGASA